jgi:trimethylamine--corrinoid protein Co-methyltransferase
MLQPLAVNTTTLDTTYFQRLTTEQCQTLHAASLEIMERVGLRFDDDEAIAMFRKAGAWVADGRIVHFPPRLVEWALGVAPRTILLYDQTGSNPLRLAWRTSYFGSITDAIFVYDVAEGRRRRATMADLVKAIRVCHALPNIEFQLSTFSVGDRPAGSADVHQIRALMEHSTKPFVFTNYSSKTTCHVIEMARALAGGPEQLRRYPFLVDYVNINSPLIHNVESIRRTFQSVDAGIPMIYRPSLVTRGLTTPLTMASFVVLNNVGSLGGLVLTQLRREGAPFIREGGPAGTVDQRTMVG